MNTRVMFTEYCPFMGAQDYGYHASTYKEARSRANASAALFNRDGSLCGSHLHTIIGGQSVAVLPLTGGDR